MVKPEEKPPLTSYRGTETVLLVEDEEPVRRYVSRLLSQNGYTVLEAATPLVSLKNKSLEVFQGNWNHYIFLMGLEEENKHLRKENALLSNQLHTDTTLDRIASCLGSTMNLYVFIEFYGLTVD